MSEQLSPIYNWIAGGLLPVQSCPRVDQRKLRDIAQLALRYPRHLVNAACAQAMDQGVHSYRHVKALTEKLVADALAALNSGPATPTAHPADLIQQHELILSSHEYGDLFAQAAGVPPRT